MLKKSKAVKKKTGYFRLVGTVTVVKTGHMVSVAENLVPESLRKSEKKLYAELIPDEAKKELRIRFSPDKDFGFVSCFYAMKRSRCYTMSAYKVLRYLGVPLKYKRYKAKIDGDNVVVKF